MQTAHVVSSNIAMIGHALNTLFIKFNSGQTYKYDGVPYDYFDALQKVESAGRFFHQFIRSKFKYERLDHDPFAAAACREA